MPTLFGSEILLKYLMRPDKQMNRRQTLLARLCKRPRTLRIAERQGLIARSTVLSSNHLGVVPPFLRPSSQ
jgi:hypothetical protein